MSAKVRRQDVHVQAVQAIDRGDHAAAVALLEGLAGKRTGAELAALALAYQGLKRHADAARACREALKSEPKNVAALVNLGISLKELGDLGEAEKVLLKARKLAPRTIEIHGNLAVVYRDQKRYLDAADCLRQALAIQPDYVPALLTLGAIHNATGDYEKALVPLAHAVRLRPDMAETHNNLGATLKHLGRREEAIRCFHQALAINPFQVKALVNLAVVHRDPAVSLQWVMKALEVEPDNSNALWLLALMQLRHGVLEDGWANYEVRWRRPDFPSERRGFRQPAWDGVEDVSDKTVLVWREQGIGDEIMFASVLPDFLRRVGRCKLEVSPKLRPLIARSFPEVQVSSPDVSADHERDDFDRHISLLSLPRFFRASLADFPPQSGYLKADPQRVAYWRERLSALPGRKIGLGWRSRKVVESDNDKYITPLVAWRPLLTVPGATFISLQYDPDPEEMAAAKAQTGIEVATFPEVDLTNDLDEAAALTAACDQVISIANAVSMMAGAVGVPVWQLGIAGYWHHLGTSGYPWFPKMRCIDKMPDATWDLAIAAAAGELARELG